MNSERKWRGGSSEERGLRKYKRMLKHLRHYRSQVLSLSATDAARRCRMDVSNYLKIEQGKTVPRASTFVSIIDGLGLDWQWK